MRIVAYAWRLIAASALSRWNQTPPEVAARFEAEVIAVTHEIEALAPGLEGAATFHVAEVLFALELATGEGEAAHGLLLLFTSNAGNPRLKAATSRRWC